MAADRDAVEEVIAEYGERQGAYVRGEQRDRLHSPLFDVQGRSVVGWRVVYEHGPWLLREVARHASPGEIGRRMRAVAVRPGTLQLAMLPCGYLGARQLRLMDAVADPRAPVVDDRPDDLATLCEFTRAVGRSFRAGERGFLPPARGGPHRILSEEEVAGLESELEPATPEAVAAVRRLSGAGATFALLLHGEQRDGVGGHGPYPTSPGRRIFAGEYTDLRNDFLPWAPPADAIPFDAVALVYEVDAGVRFGHDVYGSSAIEPADFFDRVLRLRAIARDGDSLRALELDDLPALVEAIDGARDRVYETVVGWSDRQRVEYGGWLFANHLVTFADIAGTPAEVIDELKARTADTTARTVDDLLARDEPPNLYRHLREEGVPLFSPVASSSTD